MSTDTLHACEVTADDLAALRREFEGRVQDLEHHLAEVRQRVRAIEAGGAGTPPAIRGVYIPPGPAAGCPATDGRWTLAAAGRGVARLEIPRRLRALGVRMGRAWRAFVTTPIHQEGGHP
jgi:hypothetical protein